MVPGVAVSGGAEWDAVNGAGGFEYNTWRRRGRAGVILDEEQICFCVLKENLFSGSR